MNSPNIWVGIGVDVMLGIAACIVESAACCGLL